eukprot:NODE_5652_length_628_cov_72.463074_g5488_i0.p1 GENE.NODE_5652_length_628_cov_72.463074_g5488_i0~~NODE_5652_length_628_cov_72.463074_g5488_i0.p1  ORF type:complete len:183 (+),score=67.42 NODE_5652_length_628_cov_72.463074_g5488_i0:48-551(+)
MTDVSVDLKGVHPTPQAGLHKVGELGAQGVNELRKFVQTGPQAVSAVCVLGALLTILFCLIDLILDASPLLVLLNVYGVLFGGLGLLLETSPPHCLPTKCTSCLTGLQEQLFSHLKLLTLLWGRGLFYVWLGLIQLTQLTALKLILGVWLIVCGVLCAGMHWRARPM